jgi:ABC-2 type transport system ATP-binding protein
MFPIRLEDVTPFKKLNNNDKRINIHYKKEKKEKNFDNDLASEDIQKSEGKSEINQQFINMQNNQLNEENDTQLKDGYSNQIKDKHKSKDEVELLNQAIEEQGETPETDKVNISLNQGELLIVTGPENSGKNELLLQIAGIKKIYSGKILYFNEEKLPPNRKNYLIYVPSSPLFFENRTVEENIVIMCELANIPFNYASCKIKPLYYIYGLERMKHTVVKNLPKSINSILSLFIMEILMPEVLIIGTQDFYGDQISEDFFFERLSYIKNKGIAIAISSQRFGNLNHADKILLLSEKEILFNGTKKALLQRSTGQNIEIGLMEILEKSYHKKFGK